MKRCVVTGAFGQLGQDLVSRLLEEGWDVVAVAHVSSSAPWNKQNNNSEVKGRLVLVHGDVCDSTFVHTLLREHAVHTVFHLAGVLSAVGEKDINRCWSVNLDSLRILLDEAETLKFRLFWASSIAVFGPSTPSVAPDDGPFSPQTIYGIAKLAGEHLCEYYKKKKGVDVRSLRFPGIVSFSAEPGGGTTDYSCEFFKVAAQGSAQYDCFVSAETMLPFQAMPDALDAIMLLISHEGPLSRCVFNVGGFSCAARDFESQIQKFVPNFAASYNPDFRQAIANSWPDAVDDSLFRKEVAYVPKFTLVKFSQVMMEEWRKKLSK